jgi:lytic murein transglycosylase
MLNILIWSEFLSTKRTRFVGTRSSEERQREGKLMTSNCRRPSSSNATFLALTLAIALLDAPAHAAQCGSSPDGFSAWLADFKQEAAAAGVAPSAIQASLGGATYDRRVIARDRGQGGVFKRSFEQFSARLVSPTRIARGKALMQKHAALLSAIEQRYGVPGAVVVAIWGLETGYGADSGKFNTFSALATLAYDCRRAETFREELLDALRIVERGYMTPAQMRGDWAGEIGQTQFMPSSYLKYAVDFNGDGTRDLIRDTADALASTAHFLQAKGWRSGAGWDEGEANFAVLLEWNQARIYAKTLALLADRLSGN